MITPIESLTPDYILNRGNIKFIAFNGIVKHVASWSRATGIKYSTLYNRLFTYNWKPKRALTEKVRTND